MDTDVWYASSNTDADLYSVDNPYAYPRDINADLFAAHGYDDPGIYVITVTHADTVADTTHRAGNGAYILRRYVGQ